MTVLSVGYPLFPVGPDAGGGAEQILSLLDREIVRAGHRSLVIAAEGSSVYGELLATPVSDGEITREDREKAQQAHRSIISRALKQSTVDLIHFHGLDFYAYVPKTNVPILATLHLPLDWYPKWIFQSGGFSLNCVSKTQAARTGLPVVLNGIDTQRFLVAGTKRDYLLWMGRICPEKAVHLALQVAHRLDRRMIVAGPVHDFESHHEYFAREVEPLLDEKRQYIGPVQGEEKSKLLGEARCLIVSSLVPETCSLVAMESAASGTPVVALRSGALPEVVEHGATGFIVDSDEELAGAVCSIDAISPGVCRSRAVTRFDAKRMAADYLALYSKLSLQCCVAK